MSLRDRFAYAEELAPRKSSTRENLQEVFRVWISFWRDVLIIATHAKAPIIHNDYETVLKILATELPLTEIHAQLERLEDGFDQLDKNANTRLLTEIMVMELPRHRLPGNPTQ
jgi:DNA polymerase III gamma/tau subunit